MSIETLKGQIKNIHDPRRTSYGNVRHKLEDIIVIGLCTLVCGGEDYADMEEFGIEREEFLRQFLELPNGIPDSDTFRRLFERLNPEELSECLYHWLAVEFPERCVIAVDGKTIKGSKKFEKERASPKHQQGAQNQAVQKAAKKRYRERKVNCQYRQSHLGKYSLSFGAEPDLRIW